MGNILKELVVIVESALKEFNEKDSFLIRTNENERTICSRLALYIETELQNAQYNEFTVDTEHNRGYNGDECATKRGKTGKPIVLDIVVHKREYNKLYGFDNLICIEAKKETDPRGLDADKERLKFLTDPNEGFLYKLGCMLVIHSKPELNKYWIDIESMFVKGKEWVTESIEK